MKAAAIPVIDFLTHYYRTDVGPFLTLSALPDAEAIAIMERLRDDTAYGARFKDPVKYLGDRRATERWVRAAFVARGGSPLDEHPISMVLGSSRWLAAAGPDSSLHGEVHVPLSILRAGVVSFTYPDSMVSRWLGLTRPPEFHDPALHGRVFTLAEILEAVERRGNPDESPWSRLPPGVGSYVEAQVWDRELLIGRVGARP